eukprot:GHVS01064406.1.p1 GENE.GHVS01064406.1~~GHVS01064406.1.p1  ORF type:complete len:474 (-),score=56.53 GHVS01064406.1:639-2012(-)
MTSSAGFHQPVDSCPVGLLPGSEVSPLSGHVWSDLVATVRSQLSPWYCLIYPLSTLQTRNVCVRYCQPTFYPHLLPSRPPYIPSWLSSSVSSASSRPSYVGALLASDPKVLSSSNNIIALSVNQLSLILRVEGFIGWYRGFALSAVHLICRALARRYLYALFTSPRVNQSIHCVKVLSNNCWQFAVSCLLSSARFLRLPSLLSSTERCSRAAATTYFCAPMWHIYLIVPLSPTSAKLSYCAPPKKWLSANTVSKYCAEVLAYPLLTATTRLVVYEGPERLRTADVFFLTLYYDGAKAFLNGIFPYLFTRSVDEIVDVSTATIAQNWIGRPRLSPSEMFTLRACCAAAMNALAAPLTQLSIIQRCQSSMEGLCVYRPVGTLLSLMPWKAFCIQLVLASALLTFNYMTLIAQPPPPPCRPSRRPALLPPNSLPPMLTYRRLSECSNEQRCPSAEQLTGC